MKPIRIQSMNRKSAASGTLPDSPDRARKIAAEVIRWSNRESPADHVLRAELKKATGLTPDLSRLTARMVFAYYRWLGWMPENGSIIDRLALALELQARMKSAPESFRDDELVAKAVPAWTHDVMEVTASWVRSIQNEPVLWLRAKPGIGDDLVAQLWNIAKGPLPDSYAYSGDEDLFTHRAFQGGQFEIQDLASQAVGLLCAPQPKEIWWDACAGEGGKTMHLSALMQNKGLIWASDRAEWRLSRLKRRAARAQAFNYRTAKWDGGEVLPTKTLFDGVLVDAPCSGLGTWQKNPHARWTSRREDVMELAALQFDLLSRAARSVKRNGRIIYAVCTLARNETTNVTNRFSSAHPEFRPEPFTAEWLPPNEKGPELWLWPQKWLGNGMYVAQWRRH